MTKTIELKLKSGRTLAYKEFGNPNGETIIFFHGFPGSSIQGQFFKGSSYFERFRVIAFDRPGFGSSHFQKNRRLTDIAQDVAELTEQLKIEKFHALGVSGGSPYAIATASLLPDKVLSLNLLCPLGPIYLPQVLIKLPFKAQMLLLFAKSFPGITGKIMDKALASHSDPSAASSDKSIVEQFSASLPKADIEIMQAPQIAGALGTSLQEAFAQGSVGPLHELRVFTSKWNVDLTKIKVPVFILHGAEDRIVPPAVAKYIAKIIPHSEFVLVPEEGHYSLPIKQVDRALSRLVSK